ncbi:Transmembrane protein [Toxocara canis]|uniref:Transmembrane protein 230 n=1 Tax=Toxocara canis TaxID=6265 RepID=A0A0B2VIW5_TOXCA|nr:Transmembrane protein [Toxocara canis]
MKRGAVYVVDEDSAKLSFGRTRRDVDNGFSEIQYDLPASRIPWKAVLLAGVLFVSGFVLIMSSLLMLSEVVKPSRADRVWPIFALGLIMFVPGAYHVRIAYHAFRGDSGFSFDDIPDFD